MIFLADKYCSKIFIFVKSVKRENFNLQLSFDRSVRSSSKSSYDLKNKPFLKSVILS